MDGEVELVTTRWQSSRRPFGGIVLAVVLALVPSVAAAAPPEHPGPPEDPGRGVTYQGLRLDPAGPCGHLFEIGERSNGHVDCTHGPDPAPPGTDARESQAPAVADAGPSAAASPAPSTGFACYEGGGAGGPRVQLLYAYAADKPNRFATYASSFQLWAAQADAVLSRSAQETGGIRHLRLLTDAACKPTVTAVQLTATGDDTLANTVAELRGKGYNLDSRKYLVWTDATVYCGLGQVYDDDSVGSAANPNYHNGRAGTQGMFARVDSGCWGLPGSTEAHELMHTLGGVQASAPHATAAHHCWDDQDVMCYDDSAPTTDGIVTLPGGGTHALTNVCAAAAGGERYDCNHDDYFHTNPAPGSYLATHWNTAGNVFLATWGLPDPPASVTADPSEAQVTVTWTAPRSNGGSPVTSYKLGIYDGTVLVGPVYSTVDATIAPHTFTGLTNGRSYTVQVQALTALGTSVAASATALPQLLGVAIAGPTTVGAPVVATFTEAVKGVTTANYDVVVEGTATALPATLSCQNAQGAAVSCATGPAKTAKLAVSLVPGQHYVATADPAAAAAVTSVAGAKAVPTLSATFRTLNAEEASPTRTAWASVADAAAQGGSYTTERQATAQAAYGFTGTGITWYPVTGPDQGQADVYVDNVLKLANVDNYAAARAYNVTRSVTGLTAAAHTLKIVVKGTKNASATDTRVSIDALRVEGAAVVATPSVAYAWRSVASSGASGGRYIVADVPGANASLTFRGTGVTAWFVRGPDSGKVTAKLDASTYLPFDLYNATTGSMGLTFGGLADGLHTISLSVDPTKNASSNGTKIGLDRWAVA